MAVCGVLSFGVSHGPHYRTICHTASFTHWPYETQIQVFEMFFYGASTAQLGYPGNPPAQAHFSDSFRLFEDHLRLLPGTVPSNTHSSLCIQETLALLLPLYIYTRSCS